jgi:peptide/nickel transport system permease protein
LCRNRVAVASAILFVLIAGCCLAAPLYAKHIAHTGPNANHLSDTVHRDGRSVAVVSPRGVPIGPGLSGRYLLGADGNGRDVAVRLLYGGRNSLFIGLIAALISTACGTALGLMAGYFRGVPDLVIRTYFDLMWSFPAVLLAIALGTALATSGIDIGPVTIDGGSLWIPTLILGAVYVPYLGRVVRGQSLALRNEQFVEAAVAQGMGSKRILLSELLPNVMPTILVFSTVIVANDVLTESALSYLGVGVQAPNASWGSLVNDGVDRLTTAPHLAIVAGLAITLTVLALNLLGDALRDATDPHHDASPD